MEQHRGQKDREGREAGAIDAGSPSCQPGQIPEQILPADGSDPLLDEKNYGTFLQACSALLDFAFPRLPAGPYLPPTAAKHTWVFPWRLCVISEDADIFDTVSEQKDPALPEPDWNKWETNSTHLPSSQLP